MIMHTEARGRAFGALGRFFSKLRGFSLASKQRRSLRQLEELDEHLLKDIGLTRIDVREMRRHW